MTERVNFHNQNFPPFQWQIFTIKLCILVLSSNFQRNIQLYDQMSNFLQSKSSTISMAFFHNQILHTSFELLHCSGHIREQKKMSFWWGNGVTDKQRKTTIYFFFGHQLCTIFKCLTGPATTGDPSEAIRRALHLTLINRKFTRIHLLLY
jgi:hypothetical protein